jgi:hypothetical protein
VVSLLKHVGVQSNQSTSSFGLEFSSLLSLCETSKFCRIPKNGKVLIGGFSANINMSHVIVSVFSSPKINSSVGEPRSYTDLFKKG